VILANNESSFSALPGGYLENPDDVSYPFMGDMGFFWSDSELKKSTSEFRCLKE